MVLNKICSSAKILNLIRFTILIIFIDKASLIKGSLKVSTKYIFSVYSADQSNQMTIWWGIPILFQNVDF